MTQIDGNRAPIASGQTTVVREEEPRPAGPSQAEAAHEISTTDVVEMLNADGAPAAKAAVTTDDTAAKTAPAAAQPATAAGFAHGMNSLPARLLGGAWKAVVKFFSMPSDPPRYGYYAQYKEPVREANPTAQRAQGGSVPTVSPSNYSYTRATTAAASPRTYVPAGGPKPVIAILVDGPMGGMFRGGDLPVHIGGGRIGQYHDAVKESGAEVRWIHPNGKTAEELLEGVHGVLVPGGADINPELYGQKRIPGVHLNLAPLQFDLWECSVMEAAINKQMPVRGICRGLQLLNVMGKGGTLMQDIAEHTKVPARYRYEHRYDNHPIAIVPHSEFGKQMETTIIEVGSSHHQAIADLGEGFAKVAHSADGMVEAIELINDPTVMAVQFHPERASDAVRKRFFGAFAQDASKFRSRLEGGHKDEAASVSTAAPKGPTRRELLDEGLKKLDEAGLVLVDTHQEKPVAAKDLAGYTMEVRLKGSKELLCTVPCGKGEDFALSLTGEGRMLLSPDTKDALRYVHFAVVQTGKPLGEIFGTKTGWLSKKQPLIFDIQAAWGCRDGSLVVTYAYGNNEKANEKIENLMGFYNAMRRLDDRLNRNTTKKSDASEAAGPAGDGKEPPAQAADSAATVAEAGDDRARVAEAGSEPAVAEQIVAAPPAAASVSSPPPAAGIATTSPPATGANATAAGAKESRETPE